LKNALYMVTLLSLVLLAGCTIEKLNVRTEYLSHENLASYIVETPDPLLNNPPIGQQLIVSWSLPKNYLDYEDLHLEITMRFRNREQIVKNICVTKVSGMFIYKLLNNEFIEKEGIQTYKVELIGGGEVLECWRHQLWVELIVLENQAKPTESQI
jgi:hypothetical protein